MACMWPDNYRHPVILNTILKPVKV